MDFKLCFCDVYHAIASVFYKGFYLYIHLRNGIILPFCWLRVADISVKVNVMRNRDHTIDTIGCLTMSLTTSVSL